MHNYRDFKIEYSALNGFYIYLVEDGNYLYVRRDGSIGENATHEKDKSLDGYWSSFHQAEIFLKSRFNEYDEAKERIQALSNLCKECNVAVSIGCHNMTLFDCDTELQTDIDSETLMKYFEIKRQYKKDLESLNLKWE